MILLKAQGKFLFSIRMQGRSQKLLANSEKLIMVGHRASSDTGMKLKELEFLYEIRGKLKIYYLLLAGVESEIFVWGADLCC